jgi:hypothetical protein
VADHLDDQEQTGETHQYKGQTPVEPADLRLEPGLHMMVDLAAALGVGTQMLQRTHIAGPEARTVSRSP